MKTVDNTSKEKYVTKTRRTARVIYQPKAKQKGINLKKLCLWINWWIKRMNMLERLHKMESFLMLFAQRVQQLIPTSTSFAALSVLEN